MIYTSKYDKKYYCNICKIYLPNTKPSIKRHETSKIHTDKISRSLLKNQKKKTEPNMPDPEIYEPNWTAHFNEEGVVYYYNTTTRISTYQKPKDFDVYLSLGLRSTPRA